MPTSLWDQDRQKHYGLFGDQPSIDDVGSYPQQLPSLPSHIEANAGQGATLGGKLLQAAGLDASGARAGTGLGEAAYNTAAGLYSMPHDIYGAADRLHQATTGYSIMGTPNQTRDGELGNYDMGHDALTVAGALPFGGLAAGAAREGQSVGIFGGKLAKTADHEALKQFEVNEASGLSREQNWHETGWFKGTDDKPRFEINDSGAKLNNTGQDRNTLGKAIDHPDFFSAYPHFDDKGPGYNSISPKLNYLSSKSRILDGGDGVYRGHWDGIGLRKDLDPVEMNSTMLHELQHGAQDLEGWDLDSGGAFKQGGYDQYHRMANEVEARAVEARRDLTPDQRRARPPWLDYDVPENQQLIANGDEKAALVSGAFRPSLDMSENARMARAVDQGFDTSKVWYHGTNAEPFSQFDPAHGGGAKQKSSTGLPTNGVYFADAKPHAEIYGPSQGYYLRSKKNSFYDNEPHATEYSNSRGHKTVQDHLDASALNPYSEATHYGVSNLDENFEAAASEAKGIGKPGVTFNIGKAVDKRGITGQVAIQFDPKDIRSVDAAFDPAQTHSANLLAANGDAKTAALLGAAHQQPEALGVSSSDLGMSREARMERAKEQGFDTSQTWYHGSPNNDLTEMNTGLDHSGGAWFTGDKGHAQSHAGKDGTVYEAYLNSKNPFVVDDARPSGADFEPHHNGQPLGISDNRDMVIHAASLGHDSVLFPDGTNSDYGRTMSMLDPSKIRLTDATFDPTQTHSPNLLAANGDAKTAALLGAARQQPDALGSQDDFDPQQTGFTLFPLTDKVRQHVRENGQPLFSNPKTAAIMSGLFSQNNEPPGLFGGSR